MAETVKDGGSSKAAALTKLLEGRERRRRREKAQKHNQFGTLQSKVGTIKYLQKAALQFRNAIQLCDDFAEAHVNLANTLLQLVTLEEKKSVSANGTKGNADRRVSVLLACVDHYERALPHLERANAAANQENTGFESQGAQGTHGSKDDEDQRKLDEPATSAAMSSGDERQELLAVTLHNLGVVRLRLGQELQACSLFLKALNVQPVYSDAACNVATALRLAGSCVFLVFTASAAPLCGDVMFNFLAGFHNHAVKFQWFVVNSAASVNYAHDSLASTAAANTSSSSPHCQIWSSEEVSAFRDLVRAGLPPFSAFVDACLQSSTSVPETVSKALDAVVFERQCFKPRVGVEATSTQSRRVSCQHTAVIFVKWGTKYSHEYVNRLHAGFVAHLDPSSVCLGPPLDPGDENQQAHTAVRFFCLTDDASGLAAGITPIALNDFGWGGWWNKVQLFNPQVREQLGPGLVCYVDLDTIVVGDMTPLVSTCTVQTSRSHFFCTIGAGDLECEGRQQGFNSSIMLWFEGPQSQPDTSWQTKLFNYVRNHYSVRQQSANKVEVRAPTSYACNQLFSLCAPARHRPFGLLCSGSTTCSK